MSLRTKISSWLRTAIFGRRLEREMEQEWQFHLDSRIDALVAEGHARDGAERIARREFGDLGRWKEESRHARGFRLLDELRFDVRHALRQMRRTPGFSLAVIATIALGVGINAALFSVVNAVLVRQLPYHAPERLVRLWEVTPHGDDHNVVSRGNYLDWREQATAFEDIGAHGAPYGVALTGAGEPARVLVARMTASAFRVLGVPALIGRTYDTREHGAPAGDGDDVVVVSHGFWLEHFASDTQAVGRVIHLDDRAYTIVGVMPEDFGFPAPATQVWVPATFDDRDRAERRSHNLDVIGRLKPGVGIETAKAGMSAIASRTARLFPEFMTGWGVNVVPLHGDLVGDVRPLLVTLACLALAALLAACANLASLLLARARRRETEYAIRAAIGAGRGRLVRQVVTEVVVLGTLGGAVGVGVVAAALPALVAAVPPDIPLIEHVSIDPVVLAFAAGLTLVTSLAVGLVPALRIARTDLRSSLRSVRAGLDARASRMRSGLLVAQFAFSVALLVAAALLMQSFGRLAAVDYGFDPQRLVEGMIDLPRARYPDQPAQERFHARLLERVRALPGVESAGLASDPPLAGNTMTFSFAIEGRPAKNASGREDPVSLVAVSPGYFETLKLPVVRGRTFTASDRRGALPVIVINRRLADRFWSAATAVGQHISFVGPGGPWYEIAGVVGDSRDNGLDQPAAPAIYLPFEQRRDNWTWLSWQVFVLRAKPGVDPASLARPLRQAVWSLDPNLPLLSFHTVEGLYADNAARRRFAMQLASGFAALALVLCLFGVYGVITYSVSERGREIGIRLALGARPIRILALIMKTGLGPAIIGVVIGAAVVAGLTRFLKPLLFAIEAVDAPTFGAMIALLLAAALVAAWVPARRATRIDPARSLRGE